MTREESNQAGRINGKSSLAGVIVGLLGGIAWAIITVLVGIQLLTDVDSILFTLWYVALGLVGVVIWFVRAYHSLRDLRAERGHQQPRQG